MTWSSCRADGMTQSGIRTKLHQWRVFAAAAAPGGSKLAIGGVFSQTRGSAAVAWTPVGPTRRLNIGDPPVGIMRLVTRDPGAPGTR